MSSPVSVADVITLLTQVITIYDAFFDKYQSSTAQAGHFAAHVKQFQDNLQQQKERYEELGLEYQFSDSIKLTLSECRSFLRKYDHLLTRERERKSFVKGVFQTGRLVYEKKDVERLQKMMDSATQNMVLQNQHLAMRQPIPIVRTSSMAGSNVLTPARLLLQSTSVATNNNLHSASSSSQSTVLQNTSPIVEQPLSTSPSWQAQPAPILSESPSIMQGEFGSPPQSRYTFTREPGHAHLRQPSLSTSPRSSAITMGPPEPLYSQTTSTDPITRANSTVDFPLLPQPALNYDVAKIQFDLKEYTIKRKPIGRQLNAGNQRGRELAIKDMEGTTRLKHIVQSRRTIYPYTWHPSAKSHSPLEVTFKGPTTSDHILKTSPRLPFIALLTPRPIPRYIFAKPQDFFDFQSQVRGKELVESVPFYKLSCAVSTKAGEALEQQLKLWRTEIIGKKEHSVSFYATCDSRDYEFPLSYMKREIKDVRSRTLKLEFDIPSTPARAFSYSFSRPSTSRRTTSDVSTSRQNSDFASPNLTTMNGSVPNPRSSISSFKSDAGVPSAPATTASAQSSIEAYARKMKYLEIEFDDEAGAKSFRNAYEAAWKAQACDATSQLTQWSLDAAGGGTSPAERPDSMLSTGSTRSMSSPAGDIFSLSPELGPVRS